MLAMKTDYH